MVSVDLLCDELLQEIFLRLPPTASPSVSLVCRRWLDLYRASKASASLRVTLTNSLVQSVSSFLRLYPSLTSLTLISDTSQTPSLLISNSLLICVASNCLNLRHLRFFAGPVSLTALVSLSSCKHLSYLSVSSALHISFRWLCFLPSLKELCFTKFKNRDETVEFEFDEINPEELEFDVGVSSGLPLESLCLSGVGSDDRGMEWLWRSCKKLKKLELRCCEGIGTSDSNSFINCLNSLQELELRTCRPIVDAILFNLAEHCVSLHSLLLYDGGSREGLLQFLNQSRSPLRKLDLRLPLDLENNHLLAVAENFRGLLSLRLQSSCLFTGEGLKTIGARMSVGLEELALINCDVVEKESGLLTTLGQKLKGLKKLDLSYNEMLVDKEFVSMIVSCDNLVEIKLRGCKKLTGFVLGSMSKCCKLLKGLDIVHCTAIGAEAVEVLILNSSSLKRVHVEESKLTDVAKSWASQKFMETVY